MASPQVRIVMVDDDRVDAYTTREAFQSMSVMNDFSHVESGPELFEFWDNNAESDHQEEAQLPDIILLDINMPQMSGFDVLQRMRKTDRLRDVPVVMLTTSNSDEDVRTAYQLGANAYLSKPESIADMKQMVESFEAFWFNVARIPTR